MDRTGLSPRGDNTVASRSRMFETNEEEVTKHEHEGKIFVHTTTQFACGKAFKRRFEKGDTSEA